VYPPANSTLGGCTTGTLRDSSTTPICCITLVFTFDKGCWSKNGRGRGGNESISTPDEVNIVLDLETTSGVKVGVEATEKHIHTNDVLCVIFSPDGRRMAVAQAEFIWLRDTQTGDEISLLDHAHDRVTCIAFSLDGKHIMSASSDHAIWIWNSNTGGMVLPPLQGHTDWVWSAVFPPDGSCSVPLVTTPFASGIWTVVKWC
jgi:WD40 repeat protein